MHKSEKTQNLSKDSLVRPVHSPRLATLYSAVVPGLGQAYNRKYWKIPVIYAGFGVLYYFYQANNSEYSKFKTACELKIHNDTINPGNDYVNRYPLSSLQEGRDYYRRNLEITYIITGLLYVLNILDASVDANLYDYDISPDLSMRVEPWILPYAGPVRSAPGIKITLRL